MTLADRIREALKAKGMKQQELADRLDIKRQAIAQWIRKPGKGRRTSPTHENLVKMAEILERDVSWFLTGTSAGARDRFETVYFDTDEAGRRFLDDALEREAALIAARKRSK